MRKIFLIILNWNGGEMTVNCLESVSKIKTDGYTLEVLVVDNGSIDDSIKSIENWISKNSPKDSRLKFQIIKNAKNLGFVGGNNVGISYALSNNADYVCLLNNDTRVSSDFINEMFKIFQGNEKIGIVGGKIYFEKNFEFHKERYSEKDLGKIIWYAGGKIDWQNVYASHRGVDEIDRGQYDKLSTTDFVNGCLMLVKKEVFDKIGFLDKKYFMYFEDVDFSQKAKKAGFSLYFSPKAVIWHLNAGSSSSGSNLQDYFITRNRLLFGMRWAPIRSKIALIKESFKLLSNGRPNQKKGVLDFYLGNFGQGSGENK